MSILSQTEREKLFQTACEAAKQAGMLLKESFGKHKDISFKGRIDPVTNVDLQSEETIIKIIKSCYPEHDIITEETDIEMSGSAYRWIIDPIDGTVNFAHDLPIVAVSIGLEIYGELEIGVVYNPVMGEFFHAQKGKGAFLNETQIFVSETTSLEKSLLATGFPYDIKENKNNNLSYFNHIIKHVQGVRRIGSAALDLCYCASGIFEGFWEIKLSPWDTAAGALILTEAGGLVTSFGGGKFSIYENEIVATNGKIHKELLKLLRNVT